MIFNPLCESGDFHKECDSQVIIRNLLKLNLRNIRKRTVPNILFMACLLIATPISQAGLEVLVLCYGVDGHIRMENHDAHDCAQSSTSTIQEARDESGTSVGWFGTTYSCYVCLDVTLVKNTVIGNVMPFAPVPTVRNARFSQVLVDPLRQKKVEETGMQHVPTGTIPLLMTPLSSVVLRI
jgi:hypothetical protein